MTTDGDKATGEDFLRMVRGDQGWTRSSGGTWGGHDLQGGLGVDMGRQSSQGRGWQSVGMGLGTGVGYGR